MFKYESVVLDASGSIKSKLGTRETLHARELTYGWGFGGGVLY